MPRTTGWVSYVFSAAIALTFAVSGLTPIQAHASVDYGPTVKNQGVPLDNADDDLVPPSAVTPNGILAAAVTAPSGDDRIDALLSGYSLPGTTVTYSFYEDDVFGGSYYGSQTGVHEVSEATKANVRMIMAWCESIMNVQFTEVVETASQVGYIRFMFSDGPASDGAAAYAYYPTQTTMFALSGDVHFSTTYTFQTPPGSFEYQVIVHEVGHVLGLKHSFETMPDRPVVLATGDHTTNTVMARFRTGRPPATPMAYDVLALQYMYGARRSDPSDSVYAFTPRGMSQFIVGDSTRWETTYQPKQTIWDDGGLDTIDASAVPFASQGYKLDLRDGGWLVGISEDSTTWYDYGTTLAEGSAIENVVNSGSNDTIYANEQANVFGGYLFGRSVGDDRIIGASSADTVDLAGYRPSGVSEMRVGADLVLGLGECGSVTIVDYYAGQTPTIQYGLNPLTVASLAGATRIDTAIEASREAFSSSECVVIATAYNWPDALGGSALAGALNAPILLTAPTSLPEAVAAEIARLGATRAIVLGGTGAVSDAVSSALGALPGFSVERIAGLSRYETASMTAARTIAVMNADEGFDGTAFIATGANFPDALGASPLAAAKGWPIYLANPSAGDNAALASSMKSSGVTKGLVLGGTGAVSASAETSMRLALGDTTRLAGDTRYETAVKIAIYGVTDVGLVWDKLAIATGQNFPDALAGGVLQGKSGSVMLLTPSVSLDPDVRATLVASRSAISEVRFLGGMGAVSAPVRAEVGNVLE